MIKRRYLGCVLLALAVAMPATQAATGPETAITSELAGNSPGEKRMVTPIGIGRGTRFVPITPCRFVDTRNPVGTFGGPFMAGGTTRTFGIPQSSCPVAPSAQAFSINVTVVPRQPLHYLTIWPNGQPQPLTSTLNSLNATVVANAVIVPAGIGAAVSVYVTDTTDVILDINGYFDDSFDGRYFYPLTPCRISDTRNPSGPLGGPTLLGGSTRGIPLGMSACGLPLNASAYSLNATAVPAGPLGYLTLWPAGFSQPLVSTLNSPSGLPVANAAIVPAGAGGVINAYVSDTTDLVLDTNGYFAPPDTPGGLQFYPLTPCRVVDTRAPGGVLNAPALQGGTSRDFPILLGECGIPPTAQAYSLNVTVVPRGPLYFLTVYPAGKPLPLVSTLNAFDGSITANAAIIQAGTGGSLSVYATNTTDVVLDVNGYFAP